MTRTTEPVCAGLDSKVAALRAGVEAVLDEFLRDRRRMTGAADWRESIDTLRSLVLGAGKRIRPTYCYLGWWAHGGGDDPGIVRAAAALELFHVFALIHDDVMDDSDTRRGRPTLHVSMAAAHRDRGWRGDPERFGRNAAILWGDLCLAWSDELFHGCGLPGSLLVRAVEILRRMRSEVLMGQYLDIRGEAARTDLADCLDILLHKSARYTVEHPLHIGATLAGADADGLAALSRYGIPIGEAFQLRDDVLGIFGDGTHTGKSTLTDLRDGKSTVLMALARERADPAQAAAINRWYGNPALDEAGAERLRQIVVETGALAAVETMIATRTEDAMAALDGTPMDADARAGLADLARKLSGRLN